MTKKKKQFNIGDKGWVINVAGQVYGDYDFGIFISDYRPVKKEITGVYSEKKHGTITTEYYSNSTPISLEEFFDTKEEAEEKIKGKIKEDVERSIKKANNVIRKAESTQQSLVLFASLVDTIDRNILDTQEQIEKGRKKLEKIKSKYKE